MFKNLIILILVFLVWLSYFSKSHSTEQKNHYCDVETTLALTRQLASSTCLHLQDGHSNPEKTLF